MRFSLALPVDSPPHGGVFHTQAITGVAAAVEAAGFDACWVTDHPFPPAQWVAGGGHQALDPLVALAFAAAGTTTLRLHTNVFIVQYRNPFVAAKGIATLDALSNGRVILGLAAGYLQPEFEALGADYRRRGRVLDEAIDLMREAWTGEPVDAAGDGWIAAGNAAIPVPASRPHPPLWIGGNADTAVRRALTKGDGWAPFPANEQAAARVGTVPIADIDDLGRRIEQVRVMADELGRRDPVDICFTPFSHPHGRDECNPEVFVEEVLALAAIGVTWVNFHLPAPSVDGFLENIDRFATEAIAPVRAELD
jgi:probable F420-dependent oxidoreductase